MSTTTRWSWAGWLMALAMTSCVAGEGEETGGEERGGGGNEDATIQAESAAKPAAALRGSERASTRIGAELVAIPDALAWTSDRQIALVSGEDGAIRQLVDAKGGGDERDLVYDRWQKRVVVFEQDAEAEAGEIASYPLVPGPSGALLGPRAHESWVDGNARLLASSLGIVAFEQSYGTWWKLFFSDQESVSSVAAPLPASAWIRPTESGIAIEALTIGEGLPLVRRSAAAQWTHVSAPIASSLGIAPANEPPTSRLMPAPRRGDAMLFDVLGDALVLRLVSGAKAGPPAFIPLGASGMRVEQAVPIDGGEVALLLLSGESRVLAVETDGAGGVSHLAWVSLPGEVRKETLFFSHDLALLGPRRALAATSSGAYAISITREAGSLKLALDPRFEGSALRGPLEALPAKAL